MARSSKFLGTGVTHIGSILMLTPFSHVIVDKDGAFSGFGHVDKEANAVSVELAVGDLVGFMPHVDHVTAKQTDKCFVITPEQLAVIEPLLLDEQSGSAYLGTKAYKDATLPEVVEAYDTAAAKSNSNRVAAISRWHDEQMPLELLLSCVDDATAAAVKTAYGKDADWYLQEATDAEIADACSVVTAPTVIAGTLVDDAVVADVEPATTVVITPEMSAAAASAASAQFADAPATETATETAVAAAPAAAVTPSTAVQAVQAAAEPVELPTPNANDFVDGLGTWLTATGDVALPTVEQASIPYGTLGTFQSPAADGSGVMLIGLVSSSDPSNFLWVNVDHYINAMTALTPEQMLSPA